MRFFFSLLLTSLTSAIFACSCTGEHYPLEERLCALDTLDGYVLDLKLIARQSIDINSTLHTFSVERVLRGEYSETTIVLNNGSSASCGWYELDVATIGSRFVYFGIPGYDSRNEEGVDGWTYECYYTGNIYHLGKNDTQFEYGYREGNTNRSAPGYRPRPIKDLQEDYCGTKTTGVSFFNPLSEVTISGNNGSGLLQLVFPEGTVGAADDKIEIYNAQGVTVKGKTDAAAGTINLAGLPAGVYFVMVRRGSYRKAWPVVMNR